jgi:hypothetical protein
MQLLDGHYRHRGSVLTFDDAGVTLAHLGARPGANARWDQIIGARQIGERPGHVQVLVQGHVPPHDPGNDPFAIAVASDADAFRLVTNIGWRAGSPGAVRPT